MQCNRKTRNGVRGRDVGIEASAIEELGCGANEDIYMGV